MKRGTCVAIAFDDEGRKLRVQRRGYIVRVDTVKRWGKDSQGQTIPIETEPNGQPRNGIAKIWVSIKAGEPPIEVKNQWLAFIRAGRREEWDQLRNDENVAKAEAVEPEAPETPDEPVIIVDETGVKGSHITPEERARLEGSTS